MITGIGTDCVGGVPGGTYRPGYAKKDNEHVLRLLKKLIVSSTNLKDTTTLYHMNILLSSFHVNGHTLGFNPDTQKLEPPCTA